MTKNYKKQLFPKAYAKELFQIAAGDFFSAKTLFEAENVGRLENIVFIAQQSVEKSIKSVLVHLQIAFPMVHDLGILVALLPDDKMPPGGFALTELNPFASVRRYHVGDLPLTKDEIQAAIEIAQKVNEWAQDILSN